MILIQIRGTLRFLLGNLNDFDPSHHSVPYGELPAVDTYMLYKLASILNEASTGYETYQVGPVKSCTLRYPSLNLIPHFVVFLEVFQDLSVATEICCIRPLQLLPGHCQGQVRNLFSILYFLFLFSKIHPTSSSLALGTHRLYIRSSDDPSRRSCQTVLNALLKGLLAICAPLAPHLAEDAWLSLPYEKPAESVFQAGWPSFDPSWLSLPKVSIDSGL